MPTAEIITIGTEILLGEIVDTNSRFIARALSGLGIDLFRTTTVGDNPKRIAQAIQQSMERCQIIITTGGLGPTVDDPTRDGVALAVGVQTEFVPELWEQIQARFRRFNREPTQNNKRQAYIPIGATPVENPVGTAPSFVVDTGDNIIFSLPGVPREMEYLMENAVTPYLKRRFELTEIIKMRLLHSAGAGESQIDDLISDLEEYANPTVGLSAHAGQVDIRITAKAASVEEADLLIGTVEDIVRQRLGEWIYGADDDTLEEVALRKLAAYGWKLAILEAGLNGALTGKLAQTNGSFMGGEVMTSLPETESLPALTMQVKETKGVEVALGVALYPGKEKQELHLALFTPLEERTLTRSYGGPPLLAPSWAIHLCLDLLRKVEK